MKMRRDSIAFLAQTRRRAKPSSRTSAPKDRTLHVPPLSRQRYGTDAPCDCSLSRLDLTQLNSSNSKNQSSWGHGKRARKGDGGRKREGRKSLRPRRVARESMPPQRPGWNVPTIDQKSIKSTQFLNSLGGR